MRFNLIEKLFRRTPSAANRPSPRPRLRLEALEERCCPANLMVGSGQGQYSTIQAAVMAANPGDMIQVHQGTYLGPVTISTNREGIRLDNLTIQGSGNNTIITLPGGTSNEAIIDVNGASNVTLKQLTIQGPTGNGTTIGYGIYVEGGGSATIQQDTINQIEDTPLNASDDGVAIEVGNDGVDGPATTGSATIEQDVVNGYQKGGIVVENYSSATINQNTITGLGPNTVIPQNGVQVSTGSTATINQNTISGNVYTPQAGLGGVGIILGNYTLPNGGPGAVTVDQNKMSQNDFSIYVFGPTTGEADIEQNQITSSNIGGILLNNVSGAYLSQNQVANTTEAVNNGDAGGDGIYVYGGSGNNFSQNQLQNNAWDGIEVDSSTDNIFNHNQGQSNGNDGLQLDAFNDPNNSTGNVLSQNQFQNSGYLDLEDDTTGTGTAGTGNQWNKNQGKTAYPAAINNNNDNAVLATLQVGGNQNGAYPTIQAALAAALPGDKIQINQGTYTGPIKVSTSDLDIEGGGNNTIITGTITVTGSEATLKNLTLNAGVVVDAGGSATITNDTIGQSSSGFGVVVGSASNASAAISNDSFTLDAGGTGIQVSNPGSSGSITNNNIYGGAYGVVVSNSAIANVTNNQIAGAGTDGIDMVNSGFVTAINNHLNQDGNGIYVLGPTYESSQVMLVNNQIQNSTINGIVLDGVAGALLSQNQIQNSGHDGILVTNDSTGNSFQQNQSQNNGYDGIEVDAGSTGNIFNNNQMQNNGHLDAEDDTTGTVTFGTGNYWTQNHGKTTNEAGLVS